MLQNLVGQLSGLSEVICKMPKYQTTRNGKKRRSNKTLQKGAYRVWLAPDTYYKHGKESKPYIFRTITGAVSCAVRLSGIVEPVL